MAVEPTMMTRVKTNQRQCSFLISKSTNREIDVVNQSNASAAAADCLQIYDSK